MVSTPGVLHLPGDSLAIDTTREAVKYQPHHFTHILGAMRLRGHNRLADGVRHFLICGCGRQIGRKHHKLRCLVLCQILPPGRAILLDGVTPLLDLRNEHRFRLLLTQGVHDRNLGILQGRIEHADRLAPALIMGTHGILEIGTETFAKIGHLYHPLL